MIRRISTIAIIFLLLSCPAAAQIEIEGFAWLLEPSGEASVGVDGLEGTKIDLEDDFGYSDTETTPGLRVILGDTHQLGFSGFKLDASADSILEREIRFEDNLFTINEAVSSSFELTFLQAYYRLNIGPDVFHGGVLVGGEYIGIEAEAGSPRLGNAAVDADTGMFLIGAFVESEPFKYLKLRAMGMGGAFEINDVEADYFDLEFAVMAHIPPGFQIGAGYRYIDISAEDSNFPLNIDLEFSGPTLNVGFSW